MDLKVGDVVRLRSGGPWMTVTGQRGVDVETPCAVAVDCVWFADASYNWRSFPRGALELRESHVAVAVPGPAAPSHIRIRSLSPEATTERAVVALVEVLGLSETHAAIVVRDLQIGNTVLTLWRPVLGSRERIIDHLTEAGFTVDP